MRRTRASGRRFSGRKPANVQWADVSAAWEAGLTATATQATVLIQLQAPASLTALTADPPEDLTILRMVGTWRTGLSAVGNWTLALTVADVTWTPGATVSVDNDKRLLWQQSYENVNAESVLWYPPGMFAVAAATQFPQGHTDAVKLDISPKVKVEAGKALYLVAYENSGAATLSGTCDSMRVLYKRSGRR